MIRSDSIATIKDVAHRAGVSTATVSHVLNNTRYVSDTVKRRVLEAVEQVHYVPNRSAQNLRKQRSCLLGVVLSSNLNPYFTEVLHWITTSCVKEGFSTLVSYPSSTEDELGTIDRLLSRDVDGLILNLHGPDSAVLDYLMKLEKPYTVINRKVPLQNSMVVSNDDAGGARSVMEYLWGKGHQRVGFISYPSESCMTFSQRAEAYISFMREKNSYDSDLIFWEEDECEDTSEKALDAFLKLPEPPTALFCSSDVLAMGIYKAAYNRGLSIPGDLSVVGYDDINLARYMIPPLTTVAQDKKKIGALCFESVFSSLKGLRIERHVTVETSFCERGSVLTLKEDL